MDKKYIVVNKFGEQIIIFSSVLDHKTVTGDMDIISAGFINIEFGIHCYGESQTLKIKSRPEEDSLLAEMLLRRSSHGRF